MFEGWIKSWVKDAPVGLHAIFILIVAILLFDHAVQPVLVTIDPMFAEQSVPLSQRSRIAPDTPGEVAGLVSVLTLWFSYMYAKFKIEDRYLDGS